MLYARRVEKCVMQREHCAIRVKLCGLGVKRCVVSEPESVATRVLCAEGELSAASCMEEDECRRKDYKEAVENRAMRAIWTLLAGRSPRRGWRRTG